jgi:3-oxoacyl-(acyl-carrier-protein) synthase
VSAAVTGSWVVTDAGFISAAGDASGPLAAAMRAGALPGTEEEAPSVPMAPIAAFDARTYLPGKGVKDLSRLSQLACAAASRCVPGLQGLEGDSVGVVFGSAWATVSTIVEFEREACLEGPRFVDPIRFTETVANVPGGQVAIWFGLSAFNATVSSGAASGTAAIIRALEFLEESRGRAALAGGGDALNARLLRALATDGRLAASPTSLPFSRGRTGAIGGEGASFITIESEASARERGRAPLAWIRSWATGFDPGLSSRRDAASTLGIGSSQAPPPRSPDGSSCGPGTTGPARTHASVIRRALSAAGLAAGRVGIVVAAASGDPRYDDMEGRAILEVFGDGEAAPPVAVPKGVLGETWGAHGALAAAVALEAMRTGEAPARPRGLTLDPALAPLRLPAEPLVRPIEAALVLDGTATGHVMALVLTKAGA